MKRKNIVAALAIIALSATQVMALELNIDADQEMTQEITATVTQELNTQAQKQELPDYAKLNQMFIDKLEKAAAESEYQTWAECPDCVEHYPSEGAWTTDTHSSVKEIYDETLANYKNLLETLNTKTRYNKKSQHEIRSLIATLDRSIKEISADERDEYVDFLCGQDRYFLKAKDAVVNMAFLVDGNKEFTLSYLDCIFQEPEKVKAHTFWKYLNSPEYEKEVLQGFQNEAAAGK